MRTRLAAVGMALVLAIYLVLVGQRAVMFVGTGEPVAVGIGAALIVLPVIAAWAIGRELVFGIRSEELARELEESGGLPPEDLPTRPSGAVERDAADAVFPAYREAVERDPDDWAAWFRLGLVYRAAGDTRRARQVVREAIRLHRARGAR